MLDNKPMEEVNERAFILYEGSQEIQLSDSHQVKICSKDFDALKSKCSNGSQLIRELLKYYITIPILAKLNFQKIEINYKDVLEATIGN